MKESYYHITGVICSMAGLVLVLYAVVANMLFDGITDYDFHINVCGISIIIIGVLFRIAVSKFRFKDLLVIALVVVVFCIIFLNILFTVNTYWHLENQRMAEERHDKMMHDIMTWEIEAYNRADVLYVKYTNDPEMLSAYYNIISIKPFIDAQMKDLREYMAVLIDYVTVNNYENASDQFSLCSVLNRDYHENYTFYFDQYDAMYSALDIYHGDSYFIATVDEDYFIVWEYEVENYVSELDAICRELSYIGGVLPEK